MNEINGALRDIKTTEKNQTEAKKQTKRLEFKVCAPSLEQPTARHRCVFLIFKNATLRPISGIFAQSVKIQTAQAIEKIDSAENQQRRKLCAESGRKTARRTSPPLSQVCAK